MRFQNKLFIGGEFVDALDGATMDVVNPFDGSVLTKVAEAKAADVDRAVDAAAKAFPAWRATPPTTGRSPRPTRPSTRRA